MSQPDTKIEGQYQAIRSGDYKFANPQYFEKLCMKDAEELFTMLKDDADVDANQTAAIFAAWQSVVEQIRDNPN